MAAERMFASFGAKFVHERLNALEIDYRQAQGPEVPK